MSVLPNLRAAFSSLGVWIEPAAMQLQWMFSAAWSEDTGSI
jgi:hypothetical protein